MANAKRKQPERVKLSTVQDLDPFTRAYLTAALWSTTDESTPAGGEPLDRNYDLSDLSPLAMARALNDCARFLATYGEAIDAAECKRGSGEYSTRELAGHDLWLTRNGHGAGYWDGDWPEPLATILSDAARVMGEVDLYVERGVIHCD